MEEFHNNIKSFSKKNSKLRIHSKLDRNQSKLTVCNADVLRIPQKFRLEFQSEKLFIHHQKDFLHPHLQEQ